MGILFLLTLALQYHLRILLCRFRVFRYLLLIIVKRNNNYTITMELCHELLPIISIA